MALFLELNGDVAIGREADPVAFDGGDQAERDIMVPSFWASAALVTKPTRHNLTQEAPRAFAQVVFDAAGLGTTPMKETTT